MVQILKKSQIVFLSIVTLFRIFLSQWIGNWYPSSQTFDDYILVTYANITEHFRTPNINSLIKDMGYPCLLYTSHLKQKRISVYEFLKFYPARDWALAGRFFVHFHMQRRTYTNNWLSVGGKILGHFSHSRIICLQSLYGRRRCCTARKQYILVGHGQRQGLAGIDRS